MADPVQTAIAQQQVARAGNRFMGMTFEAIAAALKATAGPSFQDQMFVSNVGNIQLNRIGPTNEAGDTINTQIRPVVAGVWADVSFQIAAPSDRFRVILGLKITLATGTAGGNVVGAQIVPSGIAQQLATLGLLRLDRSRGRMVTSRTWQFMAGSTPTRFQTPALAGGAQAIQIAVDENRIPSEYEILPHGFGAGLASCIDALNPKDRCNFTLTGLTGVTAQQVGLGANDIVLGIDALVFDAVMSGQ